MSLSLSPQQKQDVEETVKEYIDKYARDQIGRYAQAPVDNGPFEVDWRDLYQHDMEFAEGLLESPGLMEQVKAGVAEYDRLPHSPPADPSVTLSNLGDERVMQVHELRKEHIGQIVGVNAQVSQLTGNKVELDHAMFECLRCGVLTPVNQRDGEEIQEPTECRSCERQGPFRALHDHEETVHRDFQMARLEMPPELATEGSGQTVDVLLYNDLVESIEVGDRVIVIGEVILEEEEGRFNMLLKAHGADSKEDNLEIHDIENKREKIKELSQRDDLYEALVDSLAPRIVGGEDLRTIKLGLMMAAFGAETRTVGQQKVRGTPHVLLLGDPGVGKSQMIEYLEKITPRSVFASGDNSTGAGLTGATVRDDFGPGSEWTTKAGVLPRAHKGIACIDEIDKADEDTLSTLHTALEKLEIKLEKANDATLPSQTTLIAAGNPKHGRFDPYEHVADQIDLTPALMSRFDLMFMMKDKPDREKDKYVANQALRIRQYRAGEAGEDESDMMGEIEPELLTAYIAYARENVNPRLTQEAASRVEEFYTEVRQANKSDTDGEGDSGSGAAVPITARKNDAVGRLAEASARARLSEDATVEDVERAIDLVNKTLEDVEKDPVTGELDADVVETGSSRSQDYRVKETKNLIRTAAVDYDDPGAPRSEINSRASDAGLDADKVDQTLDNLLEKGEAYEPRTGWLELTE